jgi:integrase
LGDIDFGCRQITVHNGKGAKDRFVPLPDALIPSLQGAEELSGFDVRLLEDGPNGSPRQVAGVVG